MKTYDECIKKIAINEANLYYGGHMVTTDWHYRTMVGWIFEKTEAEVSNDIANIYDSACEFVCNGTKF